MIDVIIEVFKEIGYHAKYALCNASNYGVPQRRRRIIIIGSKDESLIRFPLITNYGDKEGCEDVAGDRHKRDYKKCMSCKKYYGSFVYVNREKKEFSCIFCFEHERSNKFLSEVKFKENNLVVLKNISVPARTEDMFIIEIHESRTSLKGTSDFLFCVDSNKLCDDDGFVCRTYKQTTWKSPSELRFIADDDTECENAQNWIMQNMLAGSIGHTLEKMFFDEIHKDIKTEDD